MHITGTHFNYFLVCHRKLWLFANDLQMEHNSDLVYEGKLVHETSYPQRPERYEEIEVDGIKIDYFDTRNRVVHEVKKSDSMEEAHEWQLKYYIWVLERNGFEGVTGILEYPKLRQKTEVLLSDPDRERILEMMDQIHSITDADQCPPKLKKKFCRNCSYFDLCYINEDFEEET